MVLNIKAIIKMGKNMEKESILGLMVRIILEIGNKIILMDMFNN